MTAVLRATVLLFGAWRGLDFAAAGLDGPFLTPNILVVL